MVVVRKWLEFCIFIKLETCKLDKMSRYHPLLHYVKSISRKKLSFKIARLFFFSEDGLLMDNNNQIEKSCTLQLNDEK